MTTIPTGNALDRRAARKRAQNDARRAARATANRPARTERPPRQPRLPSAPKLTGPIYVSLAPYVNGDGSVRLGAIAAECGDGQPLVVTGALTTRAALEWLWTVRERHKGRRWIAWDTTYGLNALLADLPGNAVKEAHQAGVAHVHYHREHSLTIRWVKGKSITLERHSFAFNQDTGRVERVKAGDITIWDALGYTHLPLDRAAAQWGIDAPGPVRLDRSITGPNDAANTARFIVATLAQLWPRIADAPAPLIKRRYDGAGAMAANLLHENGIREHLRAARETHTPDEVQKGTMTAYAGGRVEDFKVGHFPKLFTYDINSAYPDALLKLPSLVGRWRYTRLYESRHDWALWRVKFSIDRRETLAPLWTRQHGAVLWPLTGEGYYWGAELRLPKRVHWGDIEILDGWIWEPKAPAERPFSWVRDWYDLRADLKRRGDPAQLVVKLALNSLYGKLAQGKGHGGQPPYQSFMWAGLTTAYTRAAVYAAAAAAGDSLVAVSTDAIYTTRPLHPSIAAEIAPEGDGIGQWKHGALNDVLWVENGVYAADVSQGELLRKSIKSRGFKRGEIDFGAALAEWRTNGVAGEITRPVTRYVGIASAIAGAGTWNTWATMPMTLTFTPAAKLAGNRRTLKGLTHVDLLPWPSGGRSMAYNPRNAGITDAQLAQLAHWQLMEDQP